MTPQESNKLKAEIKELRGGYQGACYACEPVGILNKKLEADKAKLVEIVKKINIRHGAIYDTAQRCLKDLGIGE